MVWKKNPAYWGTCGAGIIPVAESTGRFLIPFRSSRVLEPHTYGTIGGKVDTITDTDFGDDFEEDFADPSEFLEEPETAALREFEEETGVSSKKILELIPLFVFEDSDIGFQYYNFLGVLKEEFTPRKNWETDSWVWVSFEELLELEPMHFGLEALLMDEESLEILKSYV